MNCYLVDFENVNSKGVNGIQQLKLTKSDRVVIYYSNNANSLTFELHRELMRLDAEIEYRKITCDSKNALDFILICELGRFTALNPDDCYYIVSNDSDYDNVIKYINGHYNCSIKKIKTISQNIVNVNKKEEPAPESFDSKLIELVENEDIDKVQAVIDAYRTKLAIHNNLVKLFGEKGKTIYERIKTILKDKN